MLFQILFPLIWIGEATKAKDKLQQAPHTGKKQAANNERSKYSYHKLTDPYKRSKNFIKLKILSWFLSEYKYFK
jgi:hypothetical protein